MNREKTAKSFDKVLSYFRQAQMEGHKVKSTGPNAWIDELRNKLKNGKKVDPDEFDKQFPKSRKK